MKSHHYVTPVGCNQANDMLYSTHIDLTYTKAATRQDG